MRLDFKSLMPRILIFFFLIFGLRVAIAQQGPTGNLQDEYILNISRIKDEIRIDGVLDEQTWQSAEKAGDFWKSFPIDTERAEDQFQTEVQVSYDDDFIYVAAICKGPAPYVVQSLKRDNTRFWNGDAFAIVFDPVNQRTNGFVFGTNPYGVQTESLITGQTGTRGSNNSGTNNAWDNKWYTESVIHEDHWTLEMAIPFKSLRYGDKKIWGLNFVRSEISNNSYHTWSPVPVQFRGVDLGYTGALVWDQKPEKSARNISVIPYVLGSGAENPEEGEPLSQSGRVGMDAKVAVTSSLNLDLTINPDFSQVDVDQQVTNLTTFNVRFPERRLFFLENSDLFEDFGIPPIRPFFSRRIGLDEEGNTIPILFGARLSGNVNKNLRLGLMNMQTRETESPGNNYTSVAVHQRVFGRTFVKGYFHNRQGFVHGEVDRIDYNRNGGLEMSYRSMDGKWQSFGGLGLSETESYSSENYFYNYAIGYDGRSFGIYSNIAGIGDNYRADMGFMPSQIHYDAVRDTSVYIGYDHFYGRVDYRIFPESPAINQHAFQGVVITDRTTSGGFIQNTFRGSYELRMNNTSNFNFQFEHQDRRLLFPFAFTDRDPLPVDFYHFNFAGASYSTDQRRSIFAQVGVEYGGFYNGDRVQYSIEMNYRVQPWGNFAITFEQNDLKFPEPYGEEQLFLIGPRAEINFTRNIFWTTFFQYNTQRDNFNINSRLQWRYKPMSDLFIVYSDNYAVEMWGPKNRALVVKLNYWFNL